MFHSPKLFMKYSQSENDGFSLHFQNDSNFIRFLLVFSIQTRHGKSLCSIRTDVLPYLLAGRMANYFSCHNKAFVHKLIRTKLSFHYFKIVCTTHPLMYPKMK